MAEEGRAFPGAGEMTKRCVEGATLALGETPGQGEPALGDPGLGHAHVELTMGHAQKDVGVGSEIAKEIDLVVPAPRCREMGGGRVNAVGDLDLELHRPRMAVEAGADEGGVV